jgi:hypothetical protein
MTIQVPSLIHVISDGNGEEQELRRRVRGEVAEVRKGMGRLGVQD